MKKARASVSTTDEDGLRKRLGSNLSNNITEVLGTSSGNSPEKTDNSNISANIGGSASQFGGSLDKIPAHSTQDQPADEDEEL